MVYRNALYATPSPGGIIKKQRGTVALLVSEGVKALCHKVKQRPRCSASVLLVLPCGLITWTFQKQDLKQTL